MKTGVEMFWSFLSVFALLILFLLLLEQKFSLRRKTQLLLPRLIINLSLSVLSYLIVLFIIFPAQSKTLELTSSNNFGLVNLLNMTSFTSTVVAFLLMDLAFYYWHRLNHIIPFLWRFHNVHHFDPDLDVTTAFRFHFMEIGFSTLFRIIQISLIGISPFAFLIYESAFTANTIFQHSNIKLPLKLERILNKLIVTPRMHGIHHSNYRDETNSNYSTVFSFWDRLHKTITLNIPQREIKIGVPGYSDKSDNKLINVLTHPFRKQKDYWKSDGKNFIQRQNYLKSDKSFLQE